MGGVGAGSPRPYLHTVFAHGLCTRSLHTVFAHVFAHGLCTRSLHTVFAHGLCTRSLHTVFAHHLTAHASSAHASSAHARLTVLAATVAALRPDRLHVPDDRRDGLLAALRTAVPGGVGADDRPDRGRGRRRHRPDPAGAAADRSRVRCVGRPTPPDGRGGADGGGRLCRLHPRRLRRSGRLPAAHLPGRERDAVSQRGGGCSGGASCGPHRRGRGGLCRLPGLGVRRLHRRRAHHGPAGHAHPPPPRSPTRTPCRAWAAPR